MRTDTHLNVKDDLNRYQFAKTLVKGLLSSFENGQESLVVGLNGEWGLGKSTLLEYIKCEIEEQTKEVDSRNFIVDFNPWSTSNQVNIQEEFFKVLGEKLGNYNVQLEQAKTDFRNLAETATEVNKVNPDVTTKFGVGTISSIIKKFTREQSTSKLKKEVDERLEDDNIKLFI
ncbi:MAG: hypothetical protein JKY48_18520, partial [Flavobacteriales bacterium]|nr:hypothetical protein [Flavobacteriales bacterium]